MPPAPPPNLTFEFHFTAVANGPPFDGIQLGAVALFGRDGALLTILSVANPGGASPGNQGPEQLVEYQIALRQLLQEGLIGPAIANNPGKWYDSTFGAERRSVLRVTLTHQAQLGAYWFLTANDRMS